MKEEVLSQDTAETERTTEECENFTADKLQSLIKGTYIHTYMVDKNHLKRNITGDRLQ